MVRQLSLLKLDSFRKVRTLIVTPSSLSRRIVKLEYMKHLRKHTRGSMKSGIPSYRLQRRVPANDPLDPVEAEWISDAMMGGLIWADNEWKGYGRQYDVTSLYPSIQQSNANFPIRQGKFQILKDFVDHRGYALYGLFRASSQGAPKGKVSGNDILFRQNKREVYTFIDLQRAKKLGLDIQLIQDGKPNALIYDSEARIPGTVIFGEYVHFLFNIKNQGGVAGRVAKRVLNTLWGALCQRKRNYKTLTTD
ncbi:hypothetical protein GLOIN_2v1472929 [Rhizophagus irregularis DAOM 181602=DAOM 197198]|nr:hypothetical protein GLOIN_2v1472929 [Rhizophagus irregularis DAOM 181602=DAOM 197198]